MSQTNWIAAFLVIGFVAYVIGNNQLSQYVAVVYGPKPQSNATGSSQSSTGLPSLPSLGSMGTTAASVLQGILP